MLESKQHEQVQETLQMTPADVDRLVVSIMTEKVNKKYNNLDREQKEIIQLYVFSKDNAEVQARLTETLNNVKRRFIGTLAANQHEFESDKVLMNKLQEIRKELQESYSDPAVITEDLVSFYLGLSKLEHEVKAK